MNCDDCNNLISVFMDDELDAARADEVRTHLALCGDCAKLFTDFATILNVCNTEPSSEILPPNSQALWCRINNLIESEIKAEAPAPEPEKGGFWQFSFTQIASAVLCVAVVSSLLTVVAIRNYMRPPDADHLATRSSATQTPFEKVLSKVGLMETPQQARERKLKEQQAAIQYWNDRVQVRRAQWDRTTRDAFDRNLNVIDEAVYEYTLILQRDPEDELSGEMLDSVLNDKMNLLRDFADL